VQVPTMPGEELPSEMDLGAHISDINRSREDCSDVPVYSGPCECTPDLGKGNSVEGAETERKARDRGIPS
jgi:hypothetical protein